MQATLSTDITNELIDDLLAALGVESFEEVELGAAFKIENGAFMDLHVEKTSPDTLSLAHYYKQNGDLIPDPSWEFKRVARGDEVHYIPIKLRQPRALGVGVREEYNPEGLAGVQDFLGTFSKNLREQGFVSTATPEDRMDEGGQ